jgi:lysophospholipase L1-like esterase
MKTLIIVGIGLLLAVGPAVGADPGYGTITDREMESPSLRPITDVPGLPRVLIIGDSVSIGYTLPTRDNLKGKANVHRPHTNCGSTAEGEKSLEAWLEDGHWDVIHFNWGLHDLKYLKADAKTQNVPPDQYERNLTDLVAKLKKTGATLIFATTTPIPVHQNGQFPRTQSDVPKYNDIARKIMEDNGVAIDDLYNAVLPKQAQLQLPENVHFSRAGYDVLATSVTQSIEKALDSRKTKAKE